MLVIHPNDSSTKVLSALYQNKKDAVVMTQNASSSDIKKSLHHLPKSERLMLLGHGSDAGLFSREGDGDEFNRIIVGHQHSYYLRGRSNIVGIWCNADLFARKEGLHGLFSGMIISEMEEAEQYGIPTTQEELDTELQIFVHHLGMHLNSDAPLHKIPEYMRNTLYHPCLLNEFNYRNLYFL